jgi:hypothetical protein
MLAITARPKSSGRWHNSHRAIGRISALVQTGGEKAGRAYSLCPVISDANLLSYCQGIVYLDAEISNSAFDLGLAE